MDTAAIHLSRIERYCDGCGRHIFQLKYFGGPVPGFEDLPILTNTRLVRTYRFDHYSPPQEVIEAIKTAYEDYPWSDCMLREDWYLGVLARIAEKLDCTEEEADQYVKWEDMSHYVGTYYECRDCVSLSLKRFHRMRINIYWGEPNKPDGVI